ncbi:uncharacterized protein ColSpa_00553 [Colletotrichum spaethianum]|uniref:Uncharacterized protein n=1 Tax=Colletotrichum spaethianum TaxID=700344 RepID=A0AA37NT26_9PEZI|nr:uncharacterized protein ColSpa_00553 [Colletotrichum spaethianum]GKT40372.1 hypothetical protein ColSpa_00553 [Colletotrichum spaethianum]
MTNISSWSTRAVVNTTSSTQTPKTISSGGYKRPRVIANEESSISDLVGEEIGKANTNQTEPRSVEAAPENGAKLKTETHIQDLESQLRAKPKEPEAGRSTEQVEEYDLEVFKK